MDGALGMGHWAWGIFYLSPLSLRKAYGIATLNAQRLPWEKFAQLLEPPHATSLLVFLVFLVLPAPSSPHPIRGNSNVTK
jgi:hypothetical protein